MLTGPEYQELLELRRLVQEQEQKIEHQSHQLRQQQIQIENLTQALLHARKKLFGPSTEVTQTEGQMSLFEQEELLHSLRQGQEEIVITEHKRKARQPGVRAEMIAALPVEVERCIVDPKEQFPICKSPLIKVGETFLEELHSRKKYSYTSLNAHLCAIRRLNDLLEGNPYRCHHGNEHEIVDSRYVDLLKRFIEECRNKGNSNDTVYAKQRWCTTF